MTEAVERLGSEMERRAGAGGEEDESRREAQAQEQTQQHGREREERELSERVKGLEQEEAEQHLPLLVRTSPVLQREVRMDAGGSCTSVLRARSAI